MQNQITTNSESEPVAAPASPAWFPTTFADVHGMNTIQLRVAPTSRAQGAGQHSITKPSPGAVDV